MAAAGKPLAARRAGQAMKTAGRAGKAAGIRQAAGQLTRAARQAAGFNGRQEARQAISGSAAGAKQAKQAGFVILSAGRTGGRPIPRP